jgi:hypothetical protein
MMTFLKTILIILLVYYGLKFLIKLLTPYIMRYISKKMAQKFENAFGNNSNASNYKQKEGSVTIDKIPSSENTSKSKVGEYVDYEEIE